MNSELVHEIWLNPDDGQMLPGMCLAGPMGDDFRALLNEGAVKVGEILASSTFEALTKYWQYQDWGVYTTDFPQDYEPYAEDWVRVQRDFFSEAK